ncbi:L-2,4-diaminobutyrate decarboxylase [Polychaeton citri CBS 116435]|uniref:L-2,4-diaminobutyrate decarboxylase n=1 Tax=Polychaeton citri CBS 116435 TaxID=1314669 RepID=A0A9P4Q1Y6_9PEZI|nr:L-2,4-diaminobutyrate decarboxylase [Polychaeton citri CBS 116435]
MAVGHTTVLPAVEQLQSSRSKILYELPATGLGDDSTARHLTDDIVPGLSKSSSSANYYGFVTGGATPASKFADNIVTEHDQNVQVHLPNETVVTDVEDAALFMVCELLELNGPGDIKGHSKSWQHRTFTTGATASNVLGLACAREFIIQQAASKLGKTASSSEEGIMRAMQIAEIDEVQVLTTAPHSSLKKAASIIGLGRSSVRDVGQDSEPHKMDLNKLAAATNKPKTASILAISCAEVNTGFFATNALVMTAVREACQWIHVDAAFGLMARTLSDTKEYRGLKAGVAGLELVDSIAGDAHKLFNVPYDCGIFLSKHLPVATSVFQNANAAYLNTASSETTASQDRTIPSPLNIGIENSRRFRALPVYANLIALGKDGYRHMLERQIRLARGIARFVSETDGYELLPAPRSATSLEERLDGIYIVVLFRASDEALNKELTQHINNTRRIYVSGTQWDGKSATRFAVANWQVDVERDLALVKEVLLGVLAR